MREALGRSRGGFGCPDWIYINRNMVERLWRPAPLASLSNPAPKGHLRPKCDSPEILPSPIGPILLHAEGDHLLSIRIRGDAGEDRADSAVLREAAAQLSAWFAGRLTRFDLPLASAGTPRGAAHREAIAAIPFGETMSYGALARAIGSSPRAVGQACRRNPFPIVIPCHRVIAAAGAIGYYSGGEGIATKLWLLEQERSVTARKG